MNKIDWELQLDSAMKAQQDGVNTEELAEQLTKYAFDENLNPITLISLPIDRIPSWIRNHASAFRFSIMRGSWGPAWSQYKTIAQYAAKLKEVKDEIAKADPTGAVVH